MLKCDVHGMYYEVPDPQEKVEPVPVIIVQAQEPAPPPRKYEKRR